MDLQGFAWSSALPELAESFCELDIPGTRLYTNRYLYNSLANSSTSRHSQMSSPRLSVLIVEYYELQLELFRDLLPRIHVRQQWIKSFIWTMRIQQAIYYFPIRIFLRISLNITNSPLIPWIISCSSGYRCKLVSYFPSTPGFARLELRAAHFCDVQIQYCTSAEQYCIWLSDQLDL